MWPWLAGLLALSRLSSFAGGANDLHFGVDMLVTVAFSLAVYLVAVRCRLPAEVAAERLRSGEDEYEEGDSTTG